ncbi:MAG: hypothetical protein ACOYL6_14690 [Bacteriovoracaceae bacterium]
MEIKAESIEDFSHLLSNRCHKIINPLSIKKSFIELNQFNVKACAKPFTMSLVESCHLECKKIMNIFNKIKTKGP